MPQRRPTLADVAAEAGVSKAAVSRVINDAPGVAPATRERVRAVIARLGCRPDSVARALASGHGDIVELIVVDDGPEGNPCAESRQEGYGRAIRDLGLPDISAVGKFRRESGYELTQRLLAGEPGLDAIFAGCDLTATGAMQALADSGVFPAVLQVRHSSVDCAVE
jgi:DNA-binding LacI/PurR family transcriptional regulator